VTNSASGVIAAANLVNASAISEPLRLSVELLVDVDDDGFLKRFRDTQLYSEHVRITTQADATVVETVEVAAVERNLIDVDSGGAGDIFGEANNNRLSLPGSNSSSRRQSLNLIFTTDHKLRLSNADSITLEATPVQQS